MDINLLLPLCALLFIAALLYTSVGHAGASAYLAIMAVFGVVPAVMKPTALVLNIVVASLTTWRFARAGQFDKALLVPLAVGSVPLAFLGGRIQLDPTIYRPLIAVVLLVAATRLLWPRAGIADHSTVPAPRFAAGAAGAGIGFLSGLTGTGGGIFLSPLVILAGWSEPRRASGTAAAFILLNSIASLTGNLASVGHLPAELPWFLVSVLGGALCGSLLGTIVLPTRRLVQALGAVLIIAAGKLALT